MYNMRYHIASLVAVFLALSVGLVLGSIVVERGAIDRQQEALVKSLQTDFVRINKENKELSTLLEASDEFTSELVPRVTGDFLVGKTILVLTNSGRTDGLSSAVEAIKSAGGSVAIVMWERPGLGLDDEKVAELVNRVLGTSGTGNAIAESVASSLAAELTQAGERPLTSALAGAKALRVEDLPDSSPVDGVVVLTSWDGKPDDLTLELARALRDREVKVVGAQALTASTGVSDAFASEGFDAVNDLGTPRGGYSLPVLLARLAQGYYGNGPSTDAPFPNVPAVTGD